jgi:hypothetical protein
MDISPISKTKSADGITLEEINDILRVKDGGISTSKIADSAITTAKIADNSVSLQKIQANLPFIVDTFEFNSSTAGQILKTFSNLPSNIWLYHIYMIISTASGPGQVGLKLDNSTTYINAAGFYNNGNGALSSLGINTHSYGLEIGRLDACSVGEIRISNPAIRYKEVRSIFQESIRIYQYKFAMDTGNDAPLSSISIGVNANFAGKIIVTGYR